MAEDSIREDLLTPVPDIAKAGWKLNTTDSEGNQSPLEASALKATQSRMGVEVSYGQRAEGYDGWVIREPNGGGSVTVPYLWINGELYVGAIRQERKAMGGYSTEASRGFSLPKETHEETAKREFEMETGAKESLGLRIKPLGNRGINPNSAFFQANPRKGEGVKFFGLQINPDEVVIRREGKRIAEVLPDGTKRFVDDPRRTVYAFTPELQGEIKELNEKIKPEGIRFFHASLLSETGDGFTLQAIGRLATQKSSVPQTG